MELTAENVDTLMRETLAERADSPGTVLGEGVRGKAAFDAARIEARRTDVRTMLDQLPAEFGEKTGGGWPFLNACVRRDGTQWGEHRSIDHLVMMGSALGLVSFVMPREMWPALAGGMPYFVIRA